MQVALKWIHKFYYVIIPIFQHLVFHPVKPITTGEGEEWLYK